MGRAEIPGRGRGFLKRLRGVGQREGLQAGSSSPGAAAYLLMLLFGLALPSPPVPSSPALWPLPETLFGLNS